MLQEGALTFAANYSDSDIPMNYRLSDSSKRWIMKFSSSFKNELFNIIVFSPQEGHPSDFV